MPYYNGIKIPNNNWATESGKFGANNMNMGWQMEREIEVSGNHSHNLQGNSSVSHALLSGTGANKPHENRPLYTVVQYIIYIKK